jgi:competence protein ComEC
VLGGSLAAGLAAANGLRCPLSAAAALLAGVSVAAAVAAPGGRLVWIVLALGIVGLGWGSVRLDRLDRSQLVHMLGRPEPTRAVITSPARVSAFAARVFGTVTRFGRRSLVERVLITLPPERAPPQGSIVEMRRAWPVEPRGPQDGFDERRWLARRGIHVVLRAADLRIVGRRGGIGGVADRLRAHLESTFELASTGERRALLTGVVLGAAHEVDGGLQDDFRASGLLHLMAVSGQNVAIIAAGVVALCWLLAVPLPWAQGIAIVVVLGYALAVGWQPSVVRATVAGILVSLAWIAGRPRDRWYALVLGAVVLLVWMPASVLEPGFQLSFAAVAAIFLVVPRITGWLEGYPVPRGLAQVAAVAAGCTAATAPIVLLQFGSVPLWGIPANVVAEAAMPPLLGLALAGAAVEPVSSSAAACARFFSGLPFATVGVVPAVLILASGVIVLAVLRFAPRYRRRDALTGLAMGVLVVGLVLVTHRAQRSWVPPAGLRVTFLDVGQGDGTLLEVPEGAVLVDEGPPEARVARQLRRLGVPSIALMVLTHPQRDHIGGAADVVNSMPVGTVLDPELPSPSADHDAFVEAATRKSVRVVAARAGDVYRLGALRLRVLWPDGPGRPGEDPNNRAVVLVATFGATDVLLTADAESDVTGRLPLRQVEILKVAHHGSNDPGLAEELRTLRPRIAVISVGRGNDYGHPTPETVATLQRLPGLRLYRTDEDGPVVIESDGHTLSVRPTLSVRSATK